MDFLLLRAILLGALIFGINAWALRHFQAGVSEFVQLNGLTAAVIWVLGWLDNNYVNKKKLAARELARKLVTAPALASLYVIAAVSTSLWTSVTIVADGSPGNIEVTVTDGEDSKHAVVEGPHGAAGLGFFGNPFGGSVLVTAAGFQPRQFALEPWTGTRIRVSEDLLRLPSIFIRVPALKQDLLNGAIMRVRAGTESPQTTILLSNVSASVQLGYHREIPNALRNEWRSELRTLRDAGTALQESFLRNWLEPARPAPAPEIMPGQELEVSVCTRADTRIAERLFVVGRDTVQDVLLHAVHGKVQCET